MKESAYALTEQDFQLFREMKAWFLRQVGNTRNRPNVPPELGQTPDVFIARAPSPGGIPAMSTGLATTGSGTGTVAQDDTPGRADCWIFRVDSSGEMESVHFSKTVYNISTTAVAAGTWVIIQRDKWGVWWANGVGSSSSTAASPSKIARTPSGGIPPLNVGALPTTGTGAPADDDTPGQALCEVFQILGGILVSTNTMISVYNLFTTRLDGWVLATPDSYGTYIGVGVPWINPVIDVTCVSGEMVITKQQYP